MHQGHFISEAIVFAFAVLTVCACKREPLPPSTSVTLSLSLGSKDALEDKVTRIEYFLFDGSGRFVSGSGGTGASQWVFRTEPGEYQVRICSGISPGQVSTVEEFDSNIVHSSCNIYSNGCFPMYFGTSVVIAEGEDKVVPVSLVRLFGKISVNSVIWGADEFTQYGVLTDLRVEKILIMNAPRQAYVNGRQLSGFLLNRWNGSSFEKCGASDAACTIREFTDCCLYDGIEYYEPCDLCSLYCLPCSGASLVLQCKAVCDEDFEYIWYYKIPLYIRSNHHYNRNISILGPGADDPLGNRSGNIRYCESDIEQWDERENQDIDF